MEFHDRIMALLKIANGPIGVDVLTLIIAPDRGMEISAALLELVMAGKITADANGISLSAVQDSEPVHDHAVPNESSPEPEQHLESMTAGEQGVRNDFVHKSEVGREDGEPEQPEPEDNEPEQPEPEDNEPEVSEPEQPELEDRLPSWPWPEYDDLPREDDPPAWAWHEYETDNRSVAESEFEAETEADIETENPDEGSTRTNADVLRAVFTEDSIDELVSLMEGHEEERSADEISNDEEKQEYCYVHRKSPVACLSLQKYTLTKLGRANVHTIEEALHGGLSPRSLGVSAHIAANVAKALAELPDMFPQELSMAQLYAACSLTNNSEYVFDMFGLAVRLRGPRRLVIDEGAYDATNSYVYQFDSAARELAEAARRALDVDGWIFWRPMFEITILPLAKEVLGEQNPLEALLNMIWSMEGFVERCRTAVSVACEKRDDMRELAESEGVRFSDDPGWEDVVEPFVSSHVYDFDSESGRLTRHCLTLSEWLNTLPADRGRMLRMRFDGKTLQEVGDEFGLTRERVRQLQSICVSRRPSVVEDKYLYFVETYSVPRGLFCSLTGEKSYVFGYLECVAQTRKFSRAPVENAVNDANISAEIREKLASTKTEACLLYDGRHIPKTKRDVTKAILGKVPDGEALSLEELVRRYESVIQENGEQANASLRLVSHRAYAAWLDRQPGILYAPVPKSLDPEQRVIRLYRRQDKPLQELKSFLESWADKNIECSARLVFEAPSFTELRNQLGLRNFYELHAIMRRYCRKIQGVHLKRVPMIVFGQASRQEQLESLIKRRGPISAEDLSAAYEEEYGVDSLVVQMNFLKDVSSLRRGDCYIIEDTKLTDAQLQLLASILSDGVNVLGEVRRRFAEVCPSVDASTIGPDAFNEIGYEIRREIVVREGFDMRSYARGLFDSHERIEVGTEILPEELSKDPDFQSVLNVELRMFSFIEIRQNVYQSLRSLKSENPQLTEALLKDYLEAVILRLQRDEVETIYSLKRRGFEHRLHDVIRDTNLDDGFLAGVASMGYVGGRLKRTRANGTVLFSKRTGVLTVDDFVEAVIRRCGTLDSRIIFKAMRDDYGVYMSGGQLRMIINKLLDNGLTVKSDVDVLEHADVQAEPADEADALEVAVCDCLSKSRRMPVARLISRLQSQYGITISAIQLRNALREMNVRFDEKRDFVYSNDIDL